MKNSVKSTVGVIVLMLMVISGFAQDGQTGQDMNTIFGNNKGFGVYLGFNSHYTSIDHQDALLIGGELTAVFGHSFNLGFKGYGLVTPVYVPDENNDRKQMALGYGGLNFEPVIFSNSAIHFTVPVLLGVGGVANLEPYSNYVEGGYEDYPDEIDYNNSDVFLVLEPGATVELNLLKFMRISGGVSYRFTDGLDLGKADVNLLEGMNYDVSLKFGIF